jgi:hypothetical protein
MAGAGKMVATAGKSKDILVAYPKEKAPRLGRVQAGRATRNFSVHSRRGLRLSAEYLVLLRVF